jgi:hypothetical protein
MALNSPIWLQELYIIQYTPREKNKDPNKLRMQYIVKRYFRDTICSLPYHTHIAVQAGILPPSDCDPDRVECRLYKERKPTICSACYLV